MTRDDSPWMTTAEVAAYARCHRRTVERGYRDYRHSNGRQGLKHIQSRPHAPCKTHREDVDRWMDGQAPTKGTRRLAAAHSA